MLWISLKAVERSPPKLQHLISIFLFKMMAVTCRQSSLPFCFQSPVVLVLTNASLLPVRCRPRPKICIPPHQGRATYSDKLFKFRNGRFEDLLNDDINEHRDVANRMAGRSVACVDRKVIHTEIKVYGDPRHTHTHTNCLECLLRTCMGAFVCLLVITHALPTPPFPACAMTVHLGEWCAIFSLLSIAPL